MTNKEKFLQAFAEAMEIPTLEEALEGTDNKKKMTPKRVRQVLGATGVVKSVNGNTPDVNGAVTIPEAVLTVWNDKGTVAFASLPAASAATVGDMYNVSTSGTTTSDFVEGAGFPVYAGANVRCCDVSGTKKWDSLSGYIDLSGYALTSSLPSVMTGATSETNGASGLVPQPLIADRTKVLSGGGVWVAQTEAYTLSKAGAVLGGIKASEKTTESVEVKIGDDDKLYVPAYPTAASGISYSNTTSGLTATTGQAAIDEVVEMIEDISIPTVMTGATSEANGASGLVPQPLIADRTKFLKGDGTYAIPAGTSDLPELSSGDAGKMLQVNEDEDGYNLIPMPSVYDVVIRTPAEFEALIADSTWFDATSVAFVGQFTLSTPNNSGVKRPANVTRIDGYNNAKITVTSFVYNSSTAKGGLWDDGNVNTPRCYINDLNVDCQGTVGGGDGVGFSGNNNIYTNCTGTVGGGYGYGFIGNNNIYTNCTGTGTGTVDGGGGDGFNGSNNIYTNCTGTGAGDDGAYGFFGNNNTYNNCTGTGTVGGGDGVGFSGNNNIYTNCTGTGTGADTGGGYGFSGTNNTYNNCTGTGIGGGGSGGSYGLSGYNHRIISCTALAYKPTGSTLSDTNCVPIRNFSTSTNLFMIIRDCKFPEITKSGYRQGTIWCNIANNTTMVGSIKDNVYHSRFTTPLVKGTNVVADNNSAVDITVI